MTKLKLVRKKLKWKYEPFDIPDRIMNSWREIGNKGEKLWKKNGNKF